MRWGMLICVALGVACGDRSGSGGEDEGASGTGESGGETGDTGDTGETSETGAPDLPAMPDLPPVTCSEDGKTEPGEICFEHVDLMGEQWFSGYVIVGDLDDDGANDVLQAVSVPCPDVHIAAPTPDPDKIPREGADLTSLRWLPGNGDGTLAELTEVETPAWISAMAIGQFNGYAFSDLGVAMGGLPGLSVVVEGNGQGILPNPLSASDTPLVNELYHAAFAELDLDGWTDMVVTTSFGPTRMYRNDGLGVFVDPLEVPLPDPFLIPVLADFDGDGTVDLALMQEYNAQGVPANVHVYWDIGTQGLALHWKGPEVARPASMIAGDLDGDGKAELLMADPNEEVLRVFQGAAQALGAELTADSGRIRTLVVGRFDGDDLLDVAAFEAWENEPKLTFHLGHAAAVVGEQITIVEGDANGESMAAGDLNGDGIDDIVFGDLHALISTP